MMGQVQRVGRCLTDDDLTAEHNEVQRTEVLVVQCLDERSS